MLFPSEQQERERQVADDDDEEALTDIEDATNTVPEQFSTGLQTPNKQIGSSSKAALGHLTPESRSVKKKSTRRLDLKPIEEEWAETSSEAPSPVPVVRTQKTSPFDSWPRTKPAASARASQDKKRAGEPHAEPAVIKRTRSGAH